MLLSKNRAVTFHNRCLQFLAVELYKVKTGIAPVANNDIFSIKNTGVSGRNQSDFYARRIRTVFHGEGSLSFLGPRIWTLIPDKIRSSESLSLFKKRIKTWQPSNCPCRICRTYIEGVGFIN